MFLAHNGESEASASALGIQRQTLGHRMGTVAEALGRDIDDPSTRTQLWIALQLNARREPGGAMGTSLHPPQLITNSRTLYLVWIPADPDGVARLVPEGLVAADDRSCYINQYVVDGPDQTSAVGAETFGAYSLTYLGANLSGLDTEAGVPGRWWTHYYNSSDVMTRYAREHGVPAGDPGRTTLTLDGDTLVATTRLDGRPVIRTTAKAEVGTPQRLAGQLRYITRRGEDFISGRYPYVADVAENFKVLSLEFLDPDHPTYQLRPADPLQVTFGFYAPSMTFCYPGGEGPLGSEHGS